jgi:hypothetical protein
MLREGKEIGEYQEDRKVTTPPEEPGARVGHLVNQRHAEILPPGVRRATGAKE